MSTNTVLTLAIVLTLSLGASACASVQPWERGTLADPRMTFGADDSGAAYTAHWQESREGSMGGSGTQGGGCGCK